MTSLRGIRIASCGSYLPAHVVTNDDLAARLDTSDEWIVSRTGIRERRRAAPDESTSTLGAAAARVALERASVDPEEVDLVICATSSPDWIQPATAAAIHGALGMRAASGAMDLNVVCSGFVYALHTGAALLAAEPSWRHVLVIGAECYSRIVDPDDRTTAVFFGDGAGAVLLARGAASGEGPVSSTSTVAARGTGPGGSGGGVAPGILATHYGVDFAKHEAIIVPAGGAREPATVEAVQQRRTRFRMDGPAVKEFAVQHLADAVEAACTGAGIAPSDLALVVPHQSNRRILEGSLARLDMPEHAMHFTVDRYGNTAGASIPITLDDAVQHGRLSPGDLACLVGYGGGLSWASLVLRWA